MRSRLHKIVPVVVTMLCVVIISLIPINVMLQGFFPTDDVLRHAAKAISGRDWSQILVLRSDMTIDIHAGWHGILTLIHKVMGCNASGLVFFSITALFILYSLTAILLLRRPESWPLTLLIILLTEGLMMSRLFYGRPYLITMSALLAIAFTWPRLAHKKMDYAIFYILTALITISTWLHGGWYLFILPIICFLLAREWRAGMHLAIIAALGIIAGAVITGHPIAFFIQTVRHVFLSFTNHGSTRILVGEFHPFDGSVTLIIAICLLLTWRFARKRWDRKVIDNPIFILAAFSWALGFMTSRVWYDLGIPAISFWIANEIQDFFEHEFHFLSWKRVILTAMILFVFYTAITSDLNGRWSCCKPAEYLNAGNPKQAEWLPEPGGIFYNDNMGIFYETFFANPNARWRYILGFEPALMPSDDLTIYRNFQMAYYSLPLLKPWADKMRPQDRLIALSPSDSPPKIESLEWHRLTAEIWSGRIPRKHENNR